MTIRYSIIVPEVKIDRLNHPGESLATGHLVVDDNEMLSVKSVKKCSVLEDLIDARFSRSASTKVPIEILCKNLFCTLEWPMKQPLEGHLIFKVGRKGIKRSTHAVHMVIDLRELHPPSGSFEQIEDVEFLNFTHPSPQHIWLKNMADAPLFVKSVAPVGEIDKVLTIEYEKQSKNYPASKIVPPHHAISFVIKPSQKARSGVYFGELHFLDAFGRRLKIPLSVMVAYNHSKLKTWLGLRRRSLFGEIESVLILKASKSGGVLTRDEAFSLAKKFSPKEILHVIKNLEQDRFIEMSNGIYIFKHLIE
jgi:hypothetical protein